MSIKVVVQDGSVEIIVKELDDNVEITTCQPQDS